MKPFSNDPLPSINKITFILGNGFDLGLGMKTSYEAVYSEYVKDMQGTDVIKAFKSNLSKRKPFDKWSDFEMGMAEYAKTLCSESELIECVRDFKTHMVNHLKNENQRMIEVIKEGVPRRILNELDRSFDRFYDGFTPNVIEQLKAISGSHVELNVITFNYTKVIEELFSLKARESKIIEKEPLHIHGSLDREVVVGVDNIDQLQGVGYAITRSGKRAFVKSIFNEQYDKARVEKAKEIIAKSSIICTYGFSMGESDKMWVDSLVNWLKENSTHHLIVYQYDETKYNLHNFDEVMEVEDNKKEQFMKSLGIEDSELFDQIHIPIGHDIFDFDFSKIVGNPLPRGTYTL